MAFAIPAKHGIMSGVYARCRTSRPERKPLSENVPVAFCQRAAAIAILLIMELALEVMSRPSLPTSSCVAIPRVVAHCSRRGFKNWGYLIGMTRSWNSHAEPFSRKTVTTAPVTSRALVYQNGSPAFWNSDSGKSPSWSASFKAGLVMSSRMAQRFPPASTGVARTIGDVRGEHLVEERQVGVGRVDHEPAHPPLAGVEPGLGLPG